MQNFSLIFSALLIAAAIFGMTIFGMNRYEIVVAPERPGDGQRTTGAWRIDRLTGKIPFCEVLRYGQTDAFYGCKVMGVAGEP